MPVAYSKRFSISSLITIDDTNNSTEKSLIEEIVINKNNKSIPPSLSSLLSSPIISLPTPSSSSPSSPSLVHSQSMKKSESIGCISNRDENEIESGIEFENRHDDSVPLECKWENCSIRFTDAKDLYDHLCNFHVGRKCNKNLSLQCKWDNCKVLTVKRDHITSHIRIHIPLKPYSCETCSKKFKRPQDLKKHYRTHLNDQMKKHRKLFNQKLNALDTESKSEIFKQNFDFSNDNSQFKRNFDSISEKRINNNFKRQNIDKSPINNYQSHLLFPPIQQQQLTNNFQIQSNNNNDNNNNDIYQPIAQYPHNIPLSHYQRPQYPNYYSLPISIPTQQFPHIALQTTQNQTQIQLPQLQTANTLEFYNSEQFQQQQSDQLMMLPNASLHPQVQQVQNAPAILQQHMQRNPFPPPLIPFNPQYQYNNYLIPTQNTQYPAQPSFSSSASGTIVYNNSHLLPSYNRL